MITYLARSIIFCPMEVVKNGEDRFKDRKLLLQPAIRKYRVVHQVLKAAFF